MSRSTSRPLRHRPLTRSVESLESRTLLSAAPVSSPGFFDPNQGTVFLKNAHSQGFSDITLPNAAPVPGLIPLAGDWDGDGVSTFGGFDPSTATWYLKNSNQPGPADIVFSYGPSNDNWLPLAGDWNGNGRDTVGFYDPDTSTWFLKDTLGQGLSDALFAYGPSGTDWRPLVGDWNGDGRDGIGFYAPGTAQWFLKNSQGQGLSDQVFNYGPAGSNWNPLAGDWDGNGQDGVGFYDRADSRWFFKNAPGQGLSDVTFRYGPKANNWAPLVGNWDGAPVSPSQPQFSSIDFVTPGGRGQVVDATFTMLARDASFRSEVGLFPVDDPQGRLGFLYPGDAGYAVAALSAAGKRIVFPPPANPGANTTTILASGQQFVLYLVENSTSEAFLQGNPAEFLNGSPVAFFSHSQASLDKLQHLRALGDNVFAWEDKALLGDRDFDDIVFRLAYGDPRNQGSANQPPSFTKGPDQVLLEDLGPQTVANWATNISPGPPSEAGQQVAFLVSNNANNLFSQQPSIAPDGTLSFTPAPNAVGTATVTVRLQDDGGTANGGNDTSATQSFQITFLSIDPGFGIRLTFEDDIVVDPESSVLAKFFFVPPTEAAVSLSRLDVAVAFDPEIIGEIGVEKGSYFAFTDLTLNVDDSTPGLLKISAILANPMDIILLAEGSLLNFFLSPEEGVIDNSSPLNVLENSGSFVTAWYNEANFPLPLSPAPTNGANDAGVDGELFVTAQGEPDGGDEFEDD